MVNHRQYSCKHEVIHFEQVLGDALYLLIFCERLPNEEVISFLRVFWLIIVFDFYLLRLGGISRQLLHDAFLSLRELAYGGHLVLDLLQVHVHVLRSNALWSILEFKKERRSFISPVLLFLQNIIFLLR